MADRRALLFSPEPPWPAHGGGALRTLSLLEYLRRHYEVDLVLFHDPAQPDPRRAIPPGVVRDLLVLDLPRHSRSLPARVARNMWRLTRGLAPLMHRFAGYERPLTAWLEGREYDLAIIEHFWAAPYAGTLRPFTRRLVLDLHNVESALYETKASQGFDYLAVPNRRIAAIYRREESLWLRKFDLLLVTSEADASRVAAFPSAVVPNTLPDTPLPQVEKDLTIAFSGNFAYEPNLDGLRWFLATIWGPLRQRVPSLRLRLVGRGDEAVRGYLGDIPAVECTGCVDDAITWIARSRVAIVPLRAGSGTRFKILEAWAAGVPVVSTSLGCEGLDVTPGINLLVADDAASFVDAIVLILKDSALSVRLCSSARIKFESQYNWSAAWRALTAAGM